jgi:hypothetical protein
MILLKSLEKEYGSLIPTCAATSFTLREGLLNSSAKPVRQEEFSAD